MAPILLGAFAPDAPMFVFFAWERWVRGVSPREIFEVLYFEPGWQALFDVWNSIPLAGLGLGVAWLLRRRGACLFFASCLAHCALDLPFHREDAHRHFFPLSAWRFESPISYWDPEHYGACFAAAETLLVWISSALLWRRHPSPWGRALLGLVSLASLSAYGGFYLAGWLP